MHEYGNINEGVYVVQSGFRSTVALIDCPYTSYRIEVYDAHSLNIVHGAAVYWTEVRRQYATRRKGGREVICAVVVGLKHCAYLQDGKQVLCTLRKEGTTLVGCPTNSRLPQFDLLEHPNMLETYWGERLEKTYFWARLISWDYNEERPKGCLLALFSNDYKTPEVESDALLDHLDIDQMPSKLSSQPQPQLPVTDHTKYEGMMFTIDPPHSIDVEDGLSLELIEDEFEVGVHISDVGAYSSFFNRKALAARGSSFYLPHKTVHMLPPELVEMCALTRKKQRLAISVFFRIDLNGNVKDTRFQRTIVTNSAQLSYDDAQSILDGDLAQDNIIDKENISLEQYQTLALKLRTLRSIAHNLRKNRRNSDIFDRGEIVFELDNKNIPINIGLKKRIETEKLVEEFMILANSEVAKLLINSFGEHSLIIYHPRPTECSIEHLNDCLSDFGVKFKADNLLLLEEQIQKLLSEGASDEIKQLLVMKALRMQEHAVYTRYQNTYKGHYGLNLENYTHFTSPMRRFADQIVHEQLRMCLRGTKPTAREIHVLDEEIELVNRARAKSKKLKQMVVECFLNMLLHHKQQTVTTKGFIVSLGMRSVMVYLPQYNIVKDLPWDHPVAYLAKDTIEVRAPHARCLFEKNDYIDLAVSSGPHQEVNIKILLP